MKIGIFGCTADPFTEAHQAIVSKVLCNHIVDHVIIAPTIVDYHREGKAPWLTDDQKLDIIYERLKNDVALSKLPSLKIGYYSIWGKDFRIREICKASPTLEDKYVKEHRFIDTLVDIIESKEWNYVGDKKNNEYYVIIGSDSYWNFKTWHMWEDIAKLAKLIVVKGRDGIDLPSAANGYPECIEIDIDDEFANVSATKIRAEWRSKGFEAYKKHVIESFEVPEEDENLLHTPIFDVVRGAKTATGLNPVKVNAPDWVTIIVHKDGTLNNGKLLIEKQFRYGSNCEIEEFPCGMVEKGEDPFDAAVRELREETGIKLLDREHIVKIGSVNPNPAFMTNTMHYFAVDLDKAKFAQVEKKLDAHEQLTAEWVDWNDFYHQTIKSVVKESHAVPAMLMTAFCLLNELSH